MEEDLNIRDLREDSDHTYFVGVRVFELYIPGCQSLKEKRFAVKSIRERLRNKFNLSVAEIGWQNLHQRSAVAVTTVSGEKKIVMQVLDKANELVEHETRIVVTDTFTEII